MGTTAILGATGPTGIHLAAELRRRANTVRAVARRTERLERLFPDTAVEKRAADMLDPHATVRAIDGCDLVYDCIGLPADQMHLHGATARSIASALHASGAHCVQVSSYWSYFPQTRHVVNESHPRDGGPPWARHRREAEDILLAAGAAILHLPDFFGPHVHTGTLQNALQDAAAGKTINWIGRTDTAREYIYVPDAMRIACQIGSHSGAFGAHWCLPGSGPLSGEAAANLATRHLGRKPRLRAAGVPMLRLASLFKKDLRRMMQVVPDYLKPVRYDATKLEALLGTQIMTSYEDGIGATLDWLRSGEPE